MNKIIHWIYKKFNNIPKGLTKENIKDLELKDSTLILRV